ncbi:hypothetical protein CYMTET_14266 [Cymbomonas tetramitiformis]|uniref:DGQHR domain-containing protein n=1 Tax=Cymbomonas tetramitiformis TaxID=36881 RepID=A0AAE0GHV8_9CHLO|nr:hypothetical protein CYMTET_14266 [Cymbomonas tetramitiformis]
MIIPEQKAIRTLIQRWTHRQESPKKLPEICPVALLPSGLRTQGSNTYTRTLTETGIKQQEDVIMQRWDESKSHIIVVWTGITKTEDEYTQDLCNAFGFTDIIDPIFIELKNRMEGDWVGRCCQMGHQFSETYLKKEFLRQKLIVVDGQHRLAAWKKLVYHKDNRNKFLDNNPSTMEGMFTGVTFLKMDTPDLVLSYIGLKVNEEAKSGTVVSHASDKWILLKKIASASSTDTADLPFEVKKKQGPSRSWYTNDLKSIVLAGYHKELRQDMTKITTFERDAQKILRILDPALGDDWISEVLQMKNYPSIIRGILGLETVSSGFGFLTFDVRYFLFALSILKKGALLEDADRKAHYASYGILTKKNLLGSEFMSYCLRLGFIRDIIEEAKARYADLMGWKKYPDWYKHQEGPSDVDSEMDANILIFGQLDNWEAEDAEVINSTTNNHNGFMDQVNARYTRIREFTGASGFVDLETVLLKFMVLTPDYANKFCISEFDAVVSAMKKANKWKREIETKPGRSNDNSVNKAAKVEAESTCHTYRTLVECAGNKETEFKKVFSNMQLYGLAFNEPPVSDMKWFVSTLGVMHTTMEFEMGCMPKLWVVQAPAASQVNLPLAIHEANKMLLSKACPELILEDSIQSNGAKAAWEFLKTRAVGANKELPATMQADTLFDVSWSPDSAIIEFHEMTIAYKEFFQVMKWEIPKDPNFFNTSQADLYKHLLRVLKAFVAKRRRWRRTCVRRWEVAAAGGRGECGGEWGAMRAEAGGGAEERRMRGGGGAEAP